jgi:CHAT domain-containing protein
MEVFYSKLAEGRTKGEALRYAQLRFIKRQGNSEGTETGTSCHPYFWAPFFLVGDTGSL